MREVKDTLGIKLVHYSKIYNMDNAQLGLILKYLLWHENQDYILDNTPEFLRNKMMKKTNENEQKLFEFLESDAVFEHIFTDMNQQVKRSRECWHNLKRNLDKKTNTNWYDFNGKEVTIIDNEGLEMDDEAACEIILTDPIDWTKAMVNKEFRKQMGIL